jgi:cytochrome c oxidase cbb3-type subunit 3
LNVHCITIERLEKDCCDEILWASESWILCDDRAMNCGVGRAIRPVMPRLGGPTLAAALCAAALFANATPVLAQASPASKSEPVNAARLAEARKTFAATCAACHGLDGHGGERGPDIASRQVHENSDEQLIRTVRNGISETGMPNFAFLGDAKIAALVSYLRVLQGTSVPLPMPGNPQKGEVLFGGAAQCAQCHMAAGSGGFIATDLSAFAAGSSPADIRRAILNPAPDGRQNRGKVVVSFANGSSQEGVVRNEDNFSLQFQSLDGTFRLVQKAEISAVKPAEQPLTHADYGKSLTPGQLDDLVSYLMHVAEKEPPKDPSKRKHQTD